MADSDNTTTLSRVIRTNAIAGRAATLYSPNNLGGGEASDPAIVMWCEWRAAHAITEQLCRSQQRLEADLRFGGGREEDYKAALRAESVAGARALNLLEQFSETPAASLAGVVAKLDAVLTEGRPGEDDAEFPWPQLRSVLEDIVRIGGLTEPAAAQADRGGSR
ncbi:hypothetical protein ACFWXH_26090 [Mesorhizobium sp. NPDC059054]|uniref:hypothetical protein n=1 Tax=Mesorhizobium sp. NPDC059054 TaxID=3346711 RepID=UPI0036C37730